MNEDFIDTLNEIRTLHLDVDRQFALFNRIVPYSQNPNEVYSPRLYSILQGACPQVISMMELLVKQLGLGSSGEKINGDKQGKFYHYYSLLNKNKMLYVQQILLKENRKALTPFRFTEQNTPKWWQDYNDTKHDLPEGAYTGRLGNVINALAALAILHDIAQSVLWFNTQTEKLLNYEYWQDRTDKVINDYKMLKRDNMSSETLNFAKRWHYPHKSNLFYYSMVFSPTIQEPFNL